jgi:ectoine hydroxylase-related dioxygenase (phytanoyl-CoA dioxygenase family)
MTLTDEAFAQYQEQGYVVVEDVVNEDERETVKSRLREYTHGDREPETFVAQNEPAVERGAVEVHDPGNAVRKMEGLGMVEEDEVFRDVAHHDRIVDVAGDLLGPNLKLLRSAAMLKPPEIGSEKSFHQDAPYYPIRPLDHCTVWIALDEATPENGCMNVVPGGHKDGLLDHETREYATDIVVSDDTYDTDDAVEVPMEPGSALFSHCLVPHYTAENTTSDWRRALIMSYMSSRSRFTQSAEERPEYVDSHHIAGESFPGCV